MIHSDFVLLSGLAVYMYNYCKIVNFRTIFYVYKILTNLDLQSILERSPYFAFEVLQYVHYFYNKPTTNILKTVFKILKYPEPELTLPDMSN